MKLVPKFLTTTLLITLITSIITYGCKPTSNPSSNPSSNPCFVEAEIMNPNETPQLSSPQYRANVVAKKRHVLELTLKV